MSTVAVLMAFLVTALFMFVLRPVAEALKLLDVPGGRKRHEKPVPLIGGVAMCVGLTFGMVLTSQPTFWGPLALAIYLLVVVGTIDDRFDLPAGVRLIAQACAALLVVFGGSIVIADLGAPVFRDVALGPFGPLFTVLFIITLINAYNVIDGIDGLAGGLAFLALSALATVGIGMQAFNLIIVLAGAVAGFLLFNLPLRVNRHAHAFMGDSGSTFLGLVVATAGISLSQGAVASMSPPVGLWFVAVPVFDLFSAIVRRTMQRRSPFSPDHEHLHHALIVNGLSRRETLVVMLSMSAACIGVGLVGQKTGIADRVLVMLWIAANFIYYHAMRRPDVVVRLVRAAQSAGLRGGGPRIAK